MNSKIFGPATAERRRRQARLSFIMLSWSRSRFFEGLLTAGGDWEQLTTLDYLPLDLGCCCCVIFVRHLLDFLITFITDNMCRDINFIGSSIQRRHQPSFKALTFNNAIVLQLLKLSGLKKFVFSCCSKSQEFKRRMLFLSFTQVTFAHALVAVVPAPWIRWMKANKLTKFT